jgi:hypothetical protein
LFPAARFTFSLLKSLREAMVLRRDKAIYPLIAFANPVYSDMKETSPGIDRSLEASDDIPPSGESPEEPSMRARAYLDIMGGHFAELPETENEARQVKAIMEAPDQSTPLQLKKDASRSNVLRLNNDNKLSEYRYLVFSCHGILPDEVDQIRNLKNGESRSNALQSAKLRLIRGEEGETYTHPFFWAPTIIFGEGS